MKRTLLTGLAAVCIAAFNAPSHALVINLTSTGDANADAGFQAAATFWESQFSDNVTVNITANFAPLGPNILGSASSTQFATNFLAMKTALGADATSADDAIMVAGLPGGSSYSKYINRTADNPNGSGSATPYVQSGITDMRMSNANAKALGLLAGNNAAQDAAITFSSLFGFDFDPTNGIGAGLFDFIAIAIHEIGHALGFISGVDVLDGNSPPEGGPFNANQFDPFASLLDFTRCSGASQAAGADIDWTADRRAKDFAIDGNCTALVSNAWSLGRNFGDGAQASHWKDNLGLGMMDPTLSNGVVGVVTALDIQALDVIGWTRVPEPATLALMALGLAGLGFSRRKKA